MIECPRCNKETISFKQKLLTGKWIDIYCSNCGARLCAQPIVLALLYFMLTWVIIYFGFLAVSEESVIFATMLAVGWFLIELFMYYIPLCILKPKNSNPPPSAD